MTASADSVANAPRSVHDMVELEQREKVRMTFSDHIADVMTLFSGSMLFVLIHAVWFAIWIPLNIPGLGPSFDPFPFGFLTMVVSLEAIFLSTFVLISQNRQALLSDKRAKLDLQVNLISEQEVTKLLEMVAQIQTHLGINDGQDAEVRRMQKPTQIRDIADTVEEIEKQLDQKERTGPSRAADTQT